MKTRAGRRTTDDGEDGPGDHRMILRPSARFTDELFVLNAKRIARELHDHEEYPNIRFALAAAALRCSDFNRYLPAEPERSEDDYKKDHPKLLNLAEIKGAKITFKGGLRRKHFETHPTHNTDVARLQMIAEQLEMSMRNWILSFQTSIPLNFRGSETRFTHVGEILMETMRRDPDLKQWVVDEETPTAKRKRFCEALAVAAAR